MADKLYSSIIDAMLDEPDFDSVGLSDAKASGESLLNLGHSHTDSSFVKSIEGDRSEVKGGIHIAKEKNRKRMAHRNEGDADVDPFISGIRPVQADWRGKAACVTSDDNALADAVSFEKAQNTTVESKTKKAVSNEQVRVGIRRLIAKGLSKDKIAAQLDKLAELAVFNRTMANDFLNNGAITACGMDYLEPNRFMEKKQFVAAERLSKVRAGAQDKTPVHDSPIVRVADITSQKTTGDLMPVVEKTAEFSPTVVEQYHKQGMSLEKIYAFGVKSAGMVRASEVIKNFVAGLKRTNIKVALSQIDCKFLKNKLAEQNAIVGAAKCGSCTYRTGMHCGLTGGTLLSFPGMDKVASKHKIASGAPEDGHQILNEFELNTRKKTADINMDGPDRQEVELGSSFSIEF